MEAKRSDGGKDNTSDSSDDDGDEEDMIGMNLEALAKKAIPRSNKSYKKHVDNFFISEYHGMPHSLFTSCHKRSKVMEAYPRTLDKKTADMIRKRIMKWEVEISKLSKG